MPALREALLAWYRRAKRDLPWRATADPYAIWLSEVMLQQTRVQTVIPYYGRFLGAYPTVHALAEAPLERVLTLWSGLGYYRRARMLHEGARAVVRDFGGSFPDTAEGLQAIRGIGRYTAGAIASIAFGRPAPLIDGNVVRVFARIFGVRDDVRGGKGLALLWRVAEAMVPVQHPGDWNQALMELGATVCLPKNPTCLLCPVRDGCDAFAQGVVDALPRLGKKAPARPVTRVALVAVKGGRVLLAKRRAGGLFGGLWEPPLVDADPEDPDDVRVIARFAALAGAGFGPAARAADVVHVLSHRRLAIRVFRAPLRRPPRATAGAAEGEYEAFDIVAVDALAALPMSTLARKVLEAAKVE